jgi:hypothetical protein
VKEREKQEAKGKKDRVEKKKEKREED